MKRRAILAYLLDRPGVLQKVSMLIRKKMYNVDTLTVCKSRKPGISRMTITLREDDEAKVSQVIHQLEKFTEVISAKELDTDHSYWREAAIIKLEIDAEALDALKAEYNFEILDHKNHDTYIIQIAGATRRIDAFVTQLGEEHIVEISRTGVAALEK
ncbi:acetolactate synthase small subunit [Geopsychrobacter electrodiphilus]|uniref:acetolactate synthase small subunit n=1 Tax=Geopsychrobacter electrodiphilus TaxID=225196 RepID=UPI000382DF5F|nr:acetolactate synthase small subunit [Geopsychrobacter electrodiphilus]